MKASDAHIFSKGLMELGWKSDGDVQVMFTLA